MEFRCRRCLPCCSQPVEGVADCGRFHMELVCRDFWVSVDLALVWHVGSIVDRPARPVALPVVDSFGRRPDHCVVWCVCGRRWWPLVRPAPGVQLSLASACFSCLRWSCLSSDMLSMASSSVLYLSLMKMPQGVPSGIWCCCAVSPESPVVWRVSGLLHVSCIGLGSWTVVDGVGPSPAASPAVAPGACRCACCVTVFPSSFLILDRNRFRWVVCFPDGAPAAPGADFGVCDPPPWPTVSARSDFRAAPLDRPRHRRMMLFIGT